MRRLPARRTAAGSVAVGVAVAGIGLAAPASTAAAQVPGVLGVEARVGAAIGAFEATGAGLEMVPGPAWGITVSWGPSERIGVYAGYSSVRFGCDSGFCRGENVSFLARGASLGARAQATLPGEPWLRAGLLLHGFEQRWGGMNGPGSETADAGTGLEAAAGITWRVAERVSLVPGLYIGFLPTRAADGVTDRAFFTGTELGVRVGI
jgi:hypothetical protein